MNETSGCCFPNARQCSATSKRARRRCRAPAVKGWTVCRFHGAGGGAPEGARNGAYQHGGFTKEVLEEMRDFREILRESREMLALLSRPR